MAHRRLHWRTLNSYQPSIFGGVSAEQTNKSHAICGRGLCIRISALSWFSCNIAGVTLSCPFPLTAFSSLNMSRSKPIPMMEHITANTYVSRCYVVQYDLGNWKVPHSSTTYVFADIGLYYISRPSASGWYVSGADDIFNANHGAPWKIPT